MRPINKRRKEEERVFTVPTVGGNVTVNAASMEEAIAEAKENGHAVLEHTDDPGNKETTDQIYVQEERWREEEREQEEEGHDDDMLPEFHPFY